MKAPTLSVTLDKTDYSVSFVSTVRFEEFHGQRKAHVFQFQNTNSGQQPQFVYGNNGGQSSAFGGTSGFSGQNGYNGMGGFGQGAQNGGQQMNPSQQNGGGRSQPDKSRPHPPRFGSTPFPQGINGFQPSSGNNQNMGVPSFGQGAQSGRQGAQGGNGQFSGGFQGGNSQNNGFQQGNQNGQNMGDPNFGQGGQNGNGQFNGAPFQAGNSQNGGFPSIQNK